MLKFVAGFFVLGLLIPIIGKGFFRDGEGASSDSTTTVGTAKSPEPPRPLREDIGQSRTDEGVFAKIKGEMLRYDNMAERNRELETRLALAIFDLNEAQLSELRDLVTQTENQDRFGGIMAALYARWAELNPAGAWAAAQVETLFHGKAREAVLLTWLTSDHETAIKEMIREKGAGNLAVASRFAAILSQHDPLKAAAFVDSLFEIWPEADSRIFPEVAKAWAEQDPVQASSWIASHWDQKTRDKLLNDIAWSASKFRGRIGLEVVEHISDPELRKAARLRALDGWGHANGAKFSEAPEHAASSIMNGLPSDWSHEDVQAFSRGYAKNFADRVDTLVALASGEEQRQDVYVGLIKGATQSEPGKLAVAIENVSLDHLRSPAGRRDAGVFFERWEAQSSAGMSDWLESLPPGPRKTELNHILNPEIPLHD